MPLARRKIEAALKKKEFEEDRSGYHRYFHQEFKGKRTGAYAIISHGSSYKEYSDSLVTAMKKPLYLDTKQEVVDLVNCPMTREDFIGILRGKGLIDD